MAKSNFDEIYVADDPREYYRTLNRFDYQIPEHGGPVFRRVAEEVSVRERPHLLDVCCSYGINAAVVNHDVTFEEVAAHYDDPALVDLDRAALVEADRHWFGARSIDPRFELTGLDSSAPAIAYGVDAQLLDTGFAENLEEAEPSTALATVVADTDLITVTGGIGYVTDRTIDRLFELTDRPRLAAFSLRWVDFAPVVDVGAAHGLVTERLDEATFPQRRMVDRAEVEHVEQELAALGIDPGGREAEGYHHTDFYLMRPASEVERSPLGELLGSVPGAIGGDGERLGAADGADLDVSVFEHGGELRRR
ncbi:MAG: hypothetical protein ACK5RL_01235 [Acidimicrobiales bacterium]